MRALSASRGESPLAATATCSGIRPMGTRKARATLACGLSKRFYPPGSCDRVAPSPELPSSDSRRPGPVRETRLVQAQKRGDRASEQGRVDHTQGLRADRNEYRAGRFRSFSTIATADIGCY
jgi:hypothetical protein